MERKEKVTKVFDGDTFLTNRRKYPVRLEGINTPEKTHPNYKKAKQELQELIMDKEISIERVARDKYKRTVAKVKIGNQSVNKIMEKYQK